MLTIPLVQEVIDRRAAPGAWERHSSVAGFEHDEGEGNIVIIYGEDGSPLANLGYRPYDPALQEDHFLFLC